MPVQRHIQALVRKSADNFPVGSLLFPRHARREILHFYSFARHADDIADSPVLDAGEKLRQLENIRLSLGTGNFRTAPEWMHGHIKDIDNGRGSAKYGLELLSAFMQDVGQQRMITFDDLLDYCGRSAIPVGRIVLDLCGEEKANLPAADALCTVLQLLNHLRDAGKDYREIDRIYIPVTWLYRYGAKESDLGKPTSTPELRQVYQLYLSECAVLLARAAPLAHSIRSIRLKLELALTFELALAMYHRLRHHDPLAAQQRIPPWTWPWHFLKSLRHLW